LRLTSRCWRSRRASGFPGCGCLSASLSASTSVDAKRGQVVDVGTNLMSVNVTDQEHRLEQVEVATTPARRFSPALRSIEPASPTGVDEAFDRGIESRRAVPGHPVPRSALMYVRRIWKASSSERSPFEPGDLPVAPTLRIDSKIFCNSEKLVGGERVIARRILPNPCSSSS
jgi:hypothetical protein